MAVLQDDIGAGIETIMKTSAFDTWLPNDRVESGNSWRDVADLGKYGRALIRTLGASAVDGMTFDTTQGVDFEYEVIFQYEAFEDCAALSSGFQNVMRQKFGDGGRTLEANITDSTGKWLGDSCQLTMGAFELEEGLENESPAMPDKIQLRVPLTVRVFQNIA